MFGNRLEAGLVAGVALFASLAGGLSAATAAPLDKPAPAAVAPAGSYVAIDPATGRMRQPSAEELRFLAQSFEALFAADKTAAVETYHADGSVSADLPDGFGHALIARLDGGRITGACVESAAAAAAVFLVPLPPAFEER